MNILLIEPFFKGSHKQWANQLKLHSKHEIEFLTIDTAGWKWSMQAGTIHLANQFNKKNYSPDLILATDMLDTATFLSLTFPFEKRPPVAIYFHENQLAYPWTSHDGKIAEKIRMNYAMINVKSALTADKLYFNSSYNKSSFIKNAKEFFKNYRGISIENDIDKIEQKSDILPLGIKLKKFDEYKDDSIEASPSIPLILWNHRWEYDKNPDSFF
ncbi:MAG: DUF3524 domain-containing protein, partial [Flavobacteriales bacterium]